MSVLDATTRKAIAKRHFREREKDVSFNGNIGTIVEFTRIVTNAEGDDILDAAVPEFAECVKVRVDN